MALASPPSAEHIVRPKLSLRLSGSHITSSDNLSEGQYTFVTPIDFPLVPFPAEQDKMNKEGSVHWAERIAALLHPGPPFFNAAKDGDLLRFLGDDKAVNASAPRAERILQRQVSLWAALDALPIGSSWSRLGHDGQAPETVDKGVDQGLWTSVSFSTSLSNPSTTHIDRSIVLPLEALKSEGYFVDDADAVRRILTVGGQECKYKIEDLSKSTSTSMGAGTVDVWSWVPFIGSTSAVESSAAKGAETAEARGLKRIWLPDSGAQSISLSASWWGFTIYLSNAAVKELEKDAGNFEKIAQRVSDALHGILSGAARKSSALPRDLAPALSSLVGVTPFVQYISTFIGWNFEDLKALVSKDDEGISLSATLILPVALVARHWTPLVLPERPCEASGGSEPKPDEDEVHISSNQGAESGSTGEQMTGDVKTYWKESVQQTRRTLRKAGTKVTLAGQKAKKVVKKTGKKKTVAFEMQPDQTVTASDTAAAGAVEEVSAKEKPAIRPRLGKKFLTNSRGHASSRETAKDGNPKEVSKRFAFAQALAASRDIVKGQLDVFARSQKQRKEEKKTEAEEKVQLLPAADPDTVGSARA